MNVHIVVKTANFALSTYNTIPPKRTINTATILTYKKRHQRARRSRHALYMSAHVPSRQPIVVNDLFPATPLDLGKSS
jgi:hypothetical protein